MASTAPIANAPKRTRKANLAPATKPRAKKVAPKTAHEITQDMLRKMNPRGNTVLKDFGRMLRDEPHKYIYPVKLYLKRDMVPAEQVLQWLRERYIESKGHIHHGTRYEVRTYGVTKNADGTPGPRYVDYILLERMDDHERVMFTLEFGDVTDEKVIRDGKLRRPRLNKDQKNELDAIVNEYYLRIAAERRAEQDKRGV